MEVHKREFSHTLIWPQFIVHWGPSNQQASEQGQICEVYMINDIHMLFKGGYVSVSIYWSFE